MQSMRSDNTRVVLVCRCSSNLLSVSVLFDSPPQGLAHLKAEQGTLFSFFFVGLVGFFFLLLFAHCLAWFWWCNFALLCLYYLSMCICVLQCSQCCCRDVGRVCVCVLVGKGAWRAWHVPRLTFIAFSHSLRLCISSPLFHPGFCVYYITVDRSQLQPLTCCDTLYCSCLDLRGDRVAEGRMEE